MSEVKKIKKLKSLGQYQMNDFCRNVSKAKLEVKHGHMTHADGLEVLFDSMQEVIRLLREVGDILERLEELDADE